MPEAEASKVNPSFLSSPTAASLALDVFIPTSPQHDFVILAQGTQLISMFPVYIEVG